MPSKNCLWFEKYYSLFNMLFAVNTEHATLLIYFSFPIFSININKKRMLFFIVCDVTL